MQIGVIYLLTGNAHAVRLIVSLWSLRRYFSGPVTVYTTRDESHAVGEACARDQRLNITHQPVSEAKSRRNSAFLTKLDLLPHSPYEITAYLDADTLIAGDISELLDVKSIAPFHATQFSNWVSSGRKIRRRIERWRSIRQDRYDSIWFQTLIDEAIVTRPAVNGGVFAFRKDATLLADWQELAWVGRKTFICDEIALQLLLHRHPHRLIDCRLNCSPVYCPQQNDVRIWHFHGEKHVRKLEARLIWWPAYQDCIENDVANVTRWTPGGDPELAAFLAELQ